MAADRRNPDREVREKLVSSGASALTDSELLAILLREGDAGESAVACACRVLGCYGGSLYRMGRASLDQMRMSGQLGVRRAAALVAAFELGRRLRIEEAAEQQMVRSDRDIADMFAPLLSELPYEEFWVVYLNASHRVVERIKVSQGGIVATVVDARLIVKRAVEKLAHAMILVHNHPSGNVTPSDEDCRLTERVRQAAALFDITLLDHLIIAEGASYSFRNHGFFDASPSQPTANETADERSSR